MAYHPSPETPPDLSTTPHPPFSSLHPSASQPGPGGINRNMAPSPSPSLPGLNISPQQAAALQPGSMVNPGVGGGGGGSGANSPGVGGGAGSAVDRLANMSISAESPSTSSASTSQPPQPQPSSTPKPADYIYFPRTPTLYPPHLLQKSTATKMRLELYYKQAVEGVVQRKERRVALEKTLIQGQGQGQGGMEDWQKARQLQGLGRRESK